MKKNMLVSMLAGALLLTSGAAFADEVPECDEPCQDGWTCEVVGASSCALPACEPGGECPEPEPCEEEYITECVPPAPEACDPAAENPCEDGLVCVTETYEECTGEPSIGAPCSIDEDGNEECPEPEERPEPECETVSESLCLPKYLDTCEVDSDCGDGFTCESSQVCYSSCEDIAVEPCEPGEECPEPEEPNCEETCEDGENYCELIEVPCGPDMACGEGFECVDIGAFDHGDPGEPPSSGGGSDDEPGVGSCIVDEDGNEVCEGGGEAGPCIVDEDGNEVCDSEDSGGTCIVDEDGNEVCEGEVPDEGDLSPEEEPESEMLCLPVGWERWVDADLGGGDYRDEASTTGNQSEDGESTGSEEPAVDDPADPNGEEEPSTPAEDPDKEEGDTAQPADNSADADEDVAAGCQSAGGQAPTGSLGLLAALGMMLGLRRRRD